MRGRGEGERAGGGAGGDGWGVVWGTTERGQDGSSGVVVMGRRRVWADADRSPLEGVQFHPESFLTEEGPRILSNFLAMR